MRQCDNQRDTVGAMGGGSSDELLAAVIKDAVAAAIEDGATMDEIVARVRAHDDEGSDLIPRARRCARARPAEGHWAERMEGLICLQRETVRFAEEWERAREPGAEGRSAPVAIETLRTLALRTMAELGQREEPVAAEDLGRLALALNRIERADRLRIEREQAAADPADAHAGAAARAARMTHAERVETVRRAFEGQFFPGRTGAAAFGWAAGPAEDAPVSPPEPAPDSPAAAPPANSCVTPPEPAPDSPADDGAQDAGGALDVCDGRDSWDARIARDTWDAHRAPDIWDARRARDAHLRRREAEGRLWPTDPPFCPAAWSGPG